MPPIVPTRLRPARATRPYGDRHVMKIPAFPEFEMGLPASRHGRGTEDDRALGCWLAHTLFNHAIPIPCASSRSVPNTQLVDSLVLSLRRYSCSNEVLLLSVYYFRRICPLPLDKHDESTCIWAIQALFNTCILLACSWRQEGSGKRKELRRYIPVTTAQEREALGLLHWDLFVSRSNWQQWLLDTRAEIQQSKRLGVRNALRCEAVVERLIEELIQYTDKLTSDNKNY
ncbi:hypothetical protein CYLTODRAFT_448773 [Cylindrobasidium torrendii FP15055 ss-10]|uniref:Uncharacterized protein n=1 Tax=Cylindrobasidium torrendii FP15055 ss-10 TaxID=1314674 RepID=A0A0D7BUF1_9AGAR|nr:hypothetical protein CYLTODRAFT_448773 [Cylindrobasidium torrendii FP15055 ss-10]